jgi:hypothetical protein
MVERHLRAPQQHLQLDHQSHRPSRRGLQIRQQDQVYGARENAALHRSRRFVFAPQTVFRRDVALA